MATTNGGTNIWRAHFQTHIVTEALVTTRSNIRRATPGSAITGTSSRQPTLGQATTDYPRETSIIWASIMYGPSCRREAKWASFRAVPTVNTGCRRWRPGFIPLRLLRAART